MPNTKLQMLFRGQNMLATVTMLMTLLSILYRSLLQMVLISSEFFDALNDIRNLETAIKAAKKENGHAQVAISYTLGEVFTS